MDIRLKMPDLSTTGSEVTLLNWLVDVGDDVKRGQPLVEIETDKATMEVEAVSAGTVKELCVEAGTEVAVGDIYIVLAKEGGAALPPTTTPSPGTPTAAASSDAARQESNQSAKKAKPGSLFAKKKRDDSQ